MIRVERFLGDGLKPFELTDPMIRELERITGLGIGAVYLRVVNGTFHGADLVEVIRLGLIGAGMTPEAAMRLVDAYARNRPMGELFPLALDVLDARWTGAPTPNPQEAQP